MLCTIGIVNVPLKFQTWSIETLTWNYRHVEALTNAIHVATKTCLRRCKEVHSTGSERMQRSLFGMLDMLLPSCECSWDNDAPLEGIYGLKCINLCMGRAGI